ncbi:hypothetical protein AG1IA_07071 [Rhizoctonia solani AG-1 IA]|uniref:Uncharacterized protein n=1 Tax=Thanatephorus cucumeris (strain AG1-IA) TaxID=983506 RepID=L8WRA8_THACA|nr:hypothetical protein AG1IA_07071 [Rhizoctonia solani AG-1 IA]
MKRTWVEQSIYADDVIVNVGPYRGPGQKSLPSLSGCHSLMCNASPSVSEHGLRLRDVDKCACIYLDDYQSREMKQKSDMSPIKTTYKLKKNSLVKYSNCTRILRPETVRFGLEIPECEIGTLFSAQVSP